MMVCGYLFIALALNCFVAPATIASAAESTVFAPVEREMDCGAQALLWPRPGSGTVLITVAVAAGSEDELVEMAGLSHYLEHLLFDGFDDFDERGVTEAFELNSAYVNAFTREQTTVFFALAPVEEAEATAALLVGMLTRSKIVPETFEKERKVILEELAKDQSDPNSVFEEQLRSLMWGGSPLAHPVGGVAETVAATDRETVVSYWKKRYGPSSWRVLITGDLPLDGLENVLKAMKPLKESAPLPLRDDPLSWPGWGQWVAGPAPETSGGGGGMAMMGGMGHGGPPASTGPDGGTLALVIAVPDGIRRTDTEVLARWLGDTGGPLMSVLSPNWVMSVETTLIARDRRDVLDIRVHAKPGVDAEELLARVFGAIKVAEAGPQDGDVLRISRAWQAERVLTGQRLHYAAVFYGEALATARDGLAESVDPMNVTPDGVRRSAALVLAETSDRRRAVWIGDGGSAQRQALPKAVLAAQGEVSSDLADGIFGSRIATLSNGLVVGILPELGGEVFGVHLLVADRSLREPAGQPGIADFMHRLLPAGTALSGSRELERRLVRAGIELKAADSPMIPFDDRYHVPDFSYARLEGPASSLEEALSLLAEMIREPMWDEVGMTAALLKHQESRTIGLRGGKLAGQRLYTALLGPDHSLARPVSGPAGELPNKSQLIEAWGRWPEGYFAPDRIVLTIASPLPVEQTLEIVEDLFSGGPESSPKRGPYPEPVPAEPVAAGDREVEGDAPQVLMLWGRRVTVESSDQAALLVAASAVSDRMVAIIREQEGLAYRLGAGVRFLPGGQWLLSASVGTRPENQERVSELMAEIVKDLADNPVADDVLLRYAARDRRTRMLRGLSAASRAYRLGRAIFEGDGSPLEVSSADRSAVTAKQVQDAVAKYLGLEEMLLVISR